MSIWCALSGQTLGWPGCAGRRRARYAGGGRRAVPAQSVPGGRSPLPSFPTAHFDLKTPLPPRGGIASGPSTQRPAPPTGPATRHPWRPRPSSLGRRSHLPRPGDRSLHTRFGRHPRPHPPPRPSPPRATRRAAPRLCRAGPAPARRGEKCRGSAGRLPTRALTGARRTEDGRPYRTCSRSMSGSRAARSRAPSRLGGGADAVTDPKDCRYVTYGHLS